jgi:nicotinic acid mononucleotide adenylyltransferase
MAHITHIEDIIIYNGANGARKALDIAYALVHEPDSLDISLKWDGAPAVYIGKDPRDGRIFVATKSILAKAPRVYKSSAAINLLAISADLKLKLIAVLREASNVNIPAGIVLHGDLLYTAPLKKELIDNKLHYVFQPNTIVYAIDCSLKLANDMEKQPIGIAWHSAYTARYTLKSLKLAPWKRYAQNMYTRAINCRAMAATNIALIDKLISDASSILDRIPVFKLNALMLRQAKLAGTCYSATYQAYINNAVANSRDYKISASGYAKYINKRFPTTATSKRAAELIRPLRQAADSDLIKWISRYQTLMSDIKLYIMKALKYDLGPIKAYKRANNKLVEISHEGLVINSDGLQTKLVNRSEFSNLNFNIAKPWIANAKRRVVLVYGRFNPPHAGHRTLINYARALTGDNAQLRIYISHTHDKNKNPLAPVRKREYMKQLFPEASKDIYLCDRESRPTLLHILTELYNDGFRALTLVVGSDRYNDMQNLISNYNGTADRHGYYKFTYEVVVAAKRSNRLINSAEEDTCDISGTRVRAHVRARNRKQFAACFAKSTNNVIIDRLYKDLCNII